MPTLHKNKSMKKAVYKIDRQLNELFSSSRIAKICMLDKKGRIIAWNAGAERMTGYTVQEVLGKNYSMFISEAEARQHAIQKALRITARKGEFSADGIRVRKDGTHFWARAFFTPMKGANGEIDFFVVMTRDITQERELDQKKEEYIGIASHELKNPITTLSLYSELLAKRLELDRDKKNLYMLRDIQGQAARLVSLVDDLLIVSKIEAGTLQLHRDVFYPHSLVKKIIKDFKQSTVSHKVIFSGTSGVQVRADKDRIAQVLINLIGNAIKYSPQADKVLIRIGQKANKCVISVQDFGSGIAKKDQKEIFVRFFRASDGDAGNIAGSGLGLYISKEIIKKHHQKIWVESAEEKGATFFFTLPLA